MTHPFAHRIQASDGRSLPDLAELWRARESIRILALRDIKVRYKQTVLGVAWAIIQPLLTMIVFTVIFDRLAKVPSDGVPYPLFTFAALLLWQLYSGSVSVAASSLVSNAGLVTKVYIPRLVLPIYGVLPALVDFCVALGLLFLLMLYYDVEPGISFLLLPLLVLLTVASALSVGVWFASLNVKYRDVRYVVPFMLQLLMFLSPVVYTSSLVPDKWKLVYYLNPMAGIIDTFRWALLGQPDFPFIGISLAIGVTLLAGLLGLWHFQRTESELADRI
ncbi:MAG: ABC transporter permease [Gemmatimonadales bacterium]|nr:ABC transporter permease [Gemmatimonadales bacterium]